MKGEIRKILVWNGSYIWIEKRSDTGYVAYESYPKALLGIASPHLMFRYSREDLKQAFETKFMIK